MHAFHRNECNLKGRSVRKDKLELYSGCWYGAYFFKFILASDLNILRTSDTLIANRIYICELVLSTEEHHFAVITDDNNAYILNTYGGVPELQIITHTIDHFNLLLDSSSDSDVFEEIFGFYPYNDSPDAEIVEIVFKEYPLILPSLDQIKIKLTKILKGLETEKDLSKLKKIINKII